MIKLHEEVEAMENNKIVKYPCPCCGYKTLYDEYRGSYECCPICFWEDDGIQFNDPNYEGGANTISLNQARENYKKYGSSEERFKINVRLPNKEELNGD